MDRELSKYAMQVIRDYDRGSDAELEIDSRAIASLRALLESTLHCDETDDDTYDEVFGIDDPVEAGLTALEILASHDVVDSVLGVVDFVKFHIHRDGNNDQLLDGIPIALAAFGSEGGVALLEQAISGKGNVTARCVLIHAVKEWGNRQQTLPPSIESLIAQSLENAPDNPVRVNTDLMMLVIDWKLDGFAESIERAFSLDRIDCGMAGDWNEVRRMLHAEGLGLPMPEKPNNSIDDFRKNVGIGCFSENIIFMLGEMKENEAGEYLDNAVGAFARSDEGKQLLSDDQEPGYVRNFLEIGLHYRGVTVDLMMVQHVREILLEMFPRKVSMEAENCKDAIDQLSAFWWFVDRVYELEWAKKIETEIRTMHSEFRRAMTDPNRYGPAKSLYMAGKAQGFDMTTQEDVQAFMKVYNSRLTAVGECQSSGALSIAPSEHAPQNSVVGMSRKQRKKLLSMKKRK